MPYIVQDRRPTYDYATTEISDALNACQDMTTAAGEANYAITRILDAWLGSKPRYWMFCMACGTLVCVLLELYRRRIGPYENEAISKNGDCYTGVPTQ